MKRITGDLFARMTETVSREDRDEMAIPSYLHRNLAMRWMAWRRVEVVARFFRNIHSNQGDKRGPTVMDFGCGTGVLFDEVSHFAEKVYGVDIVLDPARLLVDEWELGKVTLLSPEDAKQRIPENSVDTIIAAEVLEHIAPLDDTLAFFRSRLGPDGNLLVSLPTEGLLYRMGRRLAGFRGDYHLHNAASIHRLILDAGFRKVRMKKIPASGPLAIYWVINYRLR